MEVDLAEARQLAVGVEAAAADGGRQVVHVADPEAVAVVVVVAVGARLEQRVRPEEVAAGELHLVVAHVPERTERRVEREEVVAALLEHDHRPTGLGEHVGRGRAAGPGADDHDVAVALGDVTVTTRDLLVGVAPGLDVAGEPDRRATRRGRGCPPYSGAP